MFVVPPSPATGVVRDYAGGLGFEADSGYVLPPLDLLQLAAAAERDREVTLIDGQARRLTVEALIGEFRSGRARLAVVAVSLPSLAEDLDCATRLAAAGATVLARVRSADSGILTPL